MESSSEQGLIQPTTQIPEPVSLVQKIAKVVLWIVTICAAITGLYVASKIALTLFGVLFALADAAGAPNASSGGFPFAQIVTLFFSFLWGIAAPAIELLCIFGIGLFLSYFLYRKKIYIFSIVASLVFLAAGFPFVHAQLYIAGSGTTVPTGANSLSYRALVVPSFTGSGTQPSRYGVDDKKAYCDGTILQDADPKTLVSLTPPVNLPPQGNVSLYEYAKDSQRVYYDCNVIPDADPNTFTLIGDSSEYAKDATHVYSQGMLIQGADASTFSISADGSVTKDKNHVYIAGRILQGADPQTYKMIGGQGYGEDKNAVYYIPQGIAISGADPGTFVVAWVPGGPPPSCGTNCTYDAKDKNYLYRDGSIVGKISK